MRKFEVMFIELNLKGSVDI